MMSPLELRLPFYQSFRLVNQRSMIPTIMSAKNRLSMKRRLQSLFKIPTTIRPKRQVLNRSRQMLNQSKLNLLISRAFNDPNSGMATEAGVDEDIARKPDEESDLPKDKTPPKAGKWWLWLIVLSGMVVFALIRFLQSRRPSEPLFADKSDETLQYSLFAFLGDQKHDLGPLESLAEVTIGKGIGSTIYIDKEAIEEKHLRIFKKRNRIKVQNLASSPVLVNGIELTSRKKADLDLPAEIELASDVSISLINESM